MKNIARLLLAAMLATAAKPVSAAETIAAADPQPAALSTATAREGLGASASVSTPAAAGSYFNPKSDRDPTMTPADYQTIKNEERAKLEKERARRLAMLRQLKESGGESRIKLQGIVGNSVIINGEMYSAGNTVNGVKILKIGSNSIIGEYKGRKFTKILQ